MGAAPPAVGTVSTDADGRHPKAAVLRRKETAFGGRKKGRIGGDRRQKVVREVAAGRPGDEPHAPSRSRLRPRGRRPAPQQGRVGRATLEGAPIAQWPAVQRRDRHERTNVDGHRGQRATNTKVWTGCRETAHQKSASGPEDRGACPKCARVGGNRATTEKHSAAACAARARIEGWDKRKTRARQGKQAGSK